MSNRFGICALCRKECELTFEHIPPRAAFNSLPAKTVSGDKIITDDDRMPWDTSGLQYSNQQKGMGIFSLCQSCNNLTGTWYGNSYVEIAHVVHRIISQPIPDKANCISINETYPLRFIKQIISMFCSINDFDDHRMDPLREFVLNKDLSTLDPKRYKLCMYFTKGNLMKYAPLSVMLKVTDNGPEAIALSEITTYPLGFILYFDPTDTWEYDGFDITSFSNCKFDDLAEMRLPLCLNEVNDIFPSFFRTKKEIIKCIEDNKKWSEDNADRTSV